MCYIEHMENQGSILNTPRNVLKQMTPSNVNRKQVMLIGVGIVLAGILAGGVLSGKLAQKPAGAPGVVKSVTNNEVGSKDEKSFPDTAEGILKEGGIKGEGTHHLERTGGESQNVYLTSTVIDLSSFKDKKVQIWGQTFAGRWTGWIMDVGKIKILE